MELNAKIYVAGHRGLVGSAIWKELEAKGYTNLVGRSHSELDLRDRRAVEEFFQEEKPEYVFLAAAYVGGIMANNIERADFLLNNLEIQNNVISLSHRYGVKKLLFLGSTCIYPREAEQPIQESALLTDELEYTNEPYAVAKIAGMKLCESYNLQYGTNFISVMPTNLYGYNDNFDLKKSHVLPAMIRKIYLSKLVQEEKFSAIRQDLALRPIAGVEEVESLSDDDLLKLLSEMFGIKKNALELWGTGQPLREFMWSEDMAKACIYIMERINFSDLLTEGQLPRNTHINIGTGEEVSIKVLAEMIAEEMDYKGEIVFDAVHPDGTMRKLSDISRLKSLGFTHQVSLKEGVKRLVKWYNLTVS